MIKRFDSSAPREALATTRVRLAEVPALILPSDRPRGAPHARSPAAAQFKLPNALSAGLRDRAETASPRAMVLAAFEILLIRVSAQDQFAIGVVPDALGAAAIPLRVDATADDTIESLLTRAARHESEIAGRAMDVDEAPGGHLRTGFSLAMSDAPVELRPELDLMARVVAGSDDGLSFQVDYDAALFDRGTVERFANLYERVLRAVAETPNRTVRSVELGERALLRELAGGSPAAPALVPVDRSAALPLSQSERRLWFTDHFDPDQTTNNIVRAIRLRGPLADAALQRAMHDLVERHESLRTRFVTDRDAATRVIGHVPTTEMRVVDVSASARSAEDARDLVEREARQRFALARGPLFRALLVRVAQDDHLLAMTSHRIVSDGWSTDVLMRDLQALYADALAGRPASLPPLAVQYADYAVWQQAVLSAPGAEEELSYWKRQLAFVEPLELPTDYRRPAVRACAGGVVRRVIERGVADAIAASARSNGATTFIWALAGLNLLLHRYSRQTDFAVGVSVPGRSHGELESVVGCFVNTLAVRVDLAGEPTVRELVARTRDAMLGAYEHQNVPFDRVVEALNPPRDPARSPIFQVAFAPQPAAAPPAQFGAARADVFPLDLRVAEVDLTVYAFDEQDGLRLELEYDRNLFEAATVERMVRHLETVMRGMLAEPELPVSRIVLLDEAERRLVVEEWNATDTALRSEVTVHGLIEEQVDRTPEAIALTFEGRDLTYRELDARSNRLAHHLRSLGVGPNDFVAVALERSHELLIALLGVLKAGGAYVPIDPSYPSDRVAYMLEDCGAGVLLTHSRVLAGLPSPRGVVVLLDGDAFESCPESRPVAASGPRDLAYMIYTSGSTGRPKGAMNAHEGVCNRLLWIEGALGFTSTDVFLQKTPFSFDVSVGELFNPLIVGARLVIARPEGHKDPGYLVDVLARERVTTVHFVPSMLQIFLERPDVERASSLRRTLCSGEALTAPLRDAYFARFRAPLHNLYGPTEAAVEVSHWMCTPDESSSSVPIGRPVANTQLYVLDRHLAPVPVGVPGELFIGGVQVGRGYHGRPELTAEKFIADPFSSRPGARLYRTGDLTRFRADGAIEYLGRLDHQVKLRGFRIELGEIESSLMSLPGIRAAVVAAVDLAGGKRLVGYVVSDDQPFDRAAVEGALRTSLPDYMVPSTWVVLPEVPLNSSGKVDRRALPPPGEADTGASQYVAPRTPLEGRVAALMSTLLGVSRVGVEDDFFALGGHSLLAMQLLSRIARELGAELSVRTLFDGRTAAQLAIAVERTAGSRVESNPLTPTPRDGELAVSSGEARLWFIDQYDGASATYNVPIAVTLTGRLDRIALSRAVDHLVARHENLRTRFINVEGRARRVIDEPRSGSLEVVEVGAPMALEDSRARARALVTEHALRPFDLATGPLFRAELVAVSNDEHVLLLTTHHIISDGWSVGVLLRDLSALYADALENRPPSLPGLSIQYADYAVWQRARMAEDSLAAAVEYWKKQLTGLPPLDLPTDHVRPPMQRFEGGTVRWSLPRDVTDQMASLARQSGATLFMWVLAAVELLLHRYSRQEEFAVGVPVAGRRHADLADVVGFFVNTLAVRADLSGEPRVRELIGRVRDAMVAAHEHEDVPFDRVVEAVNPPRDASRSPIFQVAVVHQSAPQVVERFGSARVERFAFNTDVAKFDLTFNTVEDESGLRLELEYDRNLFEAATAERMVRHLETVMRGMLAEPELPVSRIVLLDEAERRLVIEEWNATDTALRSEVTVHGLIEEQVDRTPEAIALTFEGRDLTYRELDARSNQLAHHLRSLGVGPNDFVAVALERSHELLTALLGVLKAGGAYVPIDPSYPPDRVAYMLEDCGAKVLLTHSRVLAGLPSPRGVVVLLDGDAFESCPESRPVAASGPRDLAYMIYTSGSTGRPKGAMNAHEGVCNRLLWIEGALGFTSTDVFLQKTPFSFDVSVGELFNPLIVGARLVIARPEGHKDPGYLVDVLARERVTTVHFVPSMLQIFLERPDVERASSLRRTLCSGEALTAPLRDAYFARFRAPLHNLYGPTEAAVEVSHWMCTPDESSSSVPIGRPVANTQLYVLDRHLAPVPVGVPGELFIGGVQVGRGYHGRPELTAEKFIADPFSSRPGARLYRTGDLTRFRADGAIEYLGRLDHQVKLRGFRIELGEIESSLMSLPGIRAAVVAVVELAGGKRLVGYVVTDQERFERAAVEAALRTSLPEYMVPTTWVVLPELPLNASGKVDRRALPVPSEVGVDASRYVAPRTALEERVAAIVSALLGVSRVGVEDDFFALGGHSLLAMQLVSQIAREVGAELSVRAVFEGRTVAQLAIAIERTAGARKLSRALTPAPRDGELAVSSGEVRLWFIDQYDGGSATYNIPVAVTVTGRLDRSALSRAVDDLVERHENLRTRFINVEGSARRVIDEPRSGSLEVVEVGAPMALEDSRARARALVTEHAMRPFDLATGPLFRAELVPIADDEHVLLLTTHHIISDGWSVGVMLRDLAALYADAVENRPPSLPSLSIQYADYAAWQRALMADGSLGADVAYWTNHLAGVPPLDLPTDHVRPPTQRFEGGTVRWSLPRDVTDQMTSLARQSGATLFMWLLSAIEVLLHRYSGQETFAVGIPVAGRRHADLADVVGFFVNTLAVRADVSGEPLVCELVGRVRDAMVAAHEHEDVPFERVVEAVNPPRDASRSPIFQVAVAHQSMPTVVERLGSARVEPFAFDTNVAKFDLTFNTVEDRDGLQLELEYDRNLFEAATVERMVRHLETVMRGMLAEPELPVSRIVMLDEAERRLVVEEWNATDTALRSEATIHGLIEEQVDRTPEAIALTFEGRDLTYRELDARSNQLAHHLRSLGVGPNDFVAVALERSHELLIALLGVLKAGGAYVPIDPSYPPDRVAYMLEDCGAKVLLTHSRVLAGLPSPRGVVVLLDGDAFDSCPTSRPVAASGPRDLAYMIYTSGSTGRPKGAMNAHEGACNRLLWIEGALGFSSTDVFLQKTPFSFDVSVGELFNPLIVGARLVIARPEGHKDPGYLVDVLARERVTTVHFVPSMLQIFLERPDVERASSLRRTLCSGEALTAPLRDAYFARFRAPLHNLYGPTEAAVEVSHWMCTPDESSSSVPIGRPVANTQLYVLDRHLAPVPVGVPGELFIGGVQVGRGYHGRPELTAEKFIADPFSSRPGARLYRTGDLTRFRANGAIEYLGRLDHQVKLRGFRIELGEIESSLVSLPGLRAAVVAVVELAGGKRLVGYVVTDQERFERAAVEAALRASLPEYMVPTTWVVLPELPLNASGKVDRRALPVPTDDGIAADVVEPVTKTEIALARIAASILGVANVSMSDNFFARGGHSLIAAKFQVSIERDLGVRIPMRSLFTATTFAEIARELDVVRSAGNVESLDLMSSAAVDPPRGDFPRGLMPLSAQQRLIYYATRADPTELRTQSGAYRVEGALDTHVLVGAVDDVIAMRPVLSARVAVLDAKPALAIDVSRFTVEIIDAIGSSDDQRRARMREFSDQIDISCVDEPLARIAVFRTAPDEHELFVKLHTMIADGVSWQLLERDLVSALDARRASRDLERPRVGFFDMVRWEQSVLASPALPDVVERVRRRLQGAEPLPVFCRPRRPPGAVLAWRREIRFDEVRVETLYRVARRLATTTSTLIQTAFSVALGRWSGQSDVCTSLVLDRRVLHPEMTDVIGMLLVTAVLRIDVGRERNLVDLCATTRREVQQAFQDSVAPMELVLGTEAPSRHPLLQPTAIFVNSAARKDLLERDDERVAQFSLESLNIPQGVGGPRGGFVMTFAELDNDVHIQLSASTQALESQELDAFVAVFEDVLREVLAEPNRQG